jgi:hypothetical protein
VAYAPHSVALSGSGGKSRVGCCTVHTLPLIQPRVKVIKRLEAPVQEVMASYPLSLLVFLLLVWKIKALPMLFIASGGSLDFYNYDETNKGLPNNFLDFFVSYYFK